MKTLTNHLAAGVAALALPLAAQALDYDIQALDLGSTAGSLSRAVAINAQGQLAGYLASGQVGILAGDSLVTADLPTAYLYIDDFNDSGVALVRNYASAPGSYDHSYTFSAAGGTTEIPATRDQQYVIYGSPKINDAGQVVTYGRVGSTYVASLTQPDGGSTPLQYDNPSDQVLNLGGDGTAVGQSGLQATYWNADGTRRQLGTMGGWYAELGYVNSSGLALGARRVSGDGSASLPTVFTYSLVDGETRFIDGLVGLAGIDDAGRVYSSAQVDGASNAVVWDNGEIINLTALLGDRADAGSVFVRSVASDGRILLTNSAGTVAYVLTPTPEPGTYVLMGIGLAAAAWGARRRRAA